jgi:hypothetical protein
MIYFHVKIYKLLKLLWFFSLISKASLEFLGKSMFEGSLLCITIMIHDSY